MKKLILALSLMCSVALAVDRVITNTWEINNTPLIENNVWFLQAESVDYTVDYTLGGVPYQMTNASTVIGWEISEGNDYTNLVSIGTGTIVSVTGGVVRLTLTPEQSNLTNTTYNGYVIAISTNGAGVTNRLVLERQKIIVGWSPYGLDYLYAGVSSPYYTKGEVDTATNGIWGAMGTNHTFVTNLIADLVLTNELQYSINTNMAYLFAEFTNSQSSYNTNLSGVFSVFTNTQYSYNTNASALFTTFTNTQNGYNTNLSALFTASTNTQYSYNTNASALFTSFTNGQNSYNTNASALFTSFTNSQAGSNSAMSGRIDGLTNLFAGSGTTGRITSAAGDSGKYLKADGTWSTITADTTNATSFQIGGTNISIMVPSTGLVYTVADNTLSVTGMVSQAAFTAVSNRAFGSVSNVALNGVTNSVTNGLVDLGTIGSPTNILITPPNGVKIEQEVIRIGGSSAGAGDYYDSGLSYNSHTLWTNSASGCFIRAQNTSYNPTWKIAVNGTNRYETTVGQDYPTNKTWYVITGQEAYDPAPTTSIKATNTFDLAASLQYVSCPTGSTSFGKAMQVSYSTGIGQYFFWYSPTATNGAGTTGIWLRVLGEAF